MNEMKKKRFWRERERIDAMERAAGTPPLKHYQYPKKSVLFIYIVPDEMTFCDILYSTYNRHHHLYHYHPVIFVLIRINWYTHVLFM